LAGIETSLHKAFKIYENNVDLFITPSEFLGRKLREYGIRNETVRIPNFIDVSSIVPGHQKADYFIYYGRLSKVKGVHTLLAAMRQVRRSHLFIAGTGDEEEHLRQYATEYGLDNVSFLGHLPAEKLFPLVREAQFSVVPSEWYENYSMSVLESLASGTPVIGANIGGIPEQVKDGRNGLLFESGDAHALAGKIDFLLDRPDLIGRMGQIGRRQVEKENSPDHHYHLTMGQYERLLDGS
jgi:glycosyltransferase involved in cell wall biosynthesis